ncbi:hypothetical protein conserved [Leishmania donovani]|uniref:Uncharacterized protein n=3 Tax=Leishmania donovani species complex TaxID=38574 RepID=A4HXL0_LEIIN|nr:conserved hypothetical protein [Leishmania infantum JPCM5]XP_003859999.1 hypothetical protein, conserved [Leishmania donovani]CAC9478951.1 hypothetical_protein_-_conserved [Leishmania infantum]AYU77908.1 hypothetical protein LdCL_170020600 [Leishmania donovani]TPP51765.1 hypothetical protein CGC21_4320 [Leishmania donovani]TPP55038.1 hypothetical protein CGC20_37415 [Leishmania donovani]CAJ1987926.1 hypothetical protein conserved [Leishmania donovani]|eukprot:XP_001464801.1 conserved hypothetical protein [Leishmania infantum JPCM5]
MPGFGSLWRWLRRESAIPGVVYSDQLQNIKEELERQQNIRWAGNLRNVRLESAPHLIVRTSSSSAALPGPEEEPYTFWERIGLVPVHPSRVRARQYYHPITDFALYDYDEVSPEEKELTAKWMARVMEFNAATPAGILCVTGCLVLPLHTVYRMPLLVAAGITGVAVEVTRAYMAASQQRQDLDDFLLAKEIWYIKNVETYQLGIPRIPRGREREYQQYVDGGAPMQPQELPEELARDLHY